ncbi:LOW QUALITY PROTEIN: uncharacterized protein LOC143277153 [Babylonia areolata]|uniref:LOW QUALITY PROTEIN: uncharacterized protein LOC143277153 n=1 Tax=Babylonia areolata TaxID=304850 RepID=UPI003FD2D1EC
MAMMTDSSSMEFEDSDVIEIIPADEYDTQRAKLKASISWLLTKAYGSSVPSDLKDPFYEDAKGQLQVKPQLMNQMTSSELYCQACSNMFCDSSASQWHGFWSIIQVLSRKGIYVAEDGETVVTETVLMHTAPFKVMAHLALIDALMKAYTSEIASVEKVVQAVRRYSSFSASSELPGSPEEALVFWINKTCGALATRGDLDIIQGESSQKVRIVSKTPREPRHVPVLKDLMEDLGDGCSVAAAIAFYMPDALPVTDACLKENVGIADSLYNLRLIRTFCERHLVLKCFHFTYEDLLYGKENLRDNVLVFLAELFFLLEAGQQGGATAKKDAAASEGAVHVSARRLPSPSIPQVSGATKRSFQKTADDGRHHLEKISACPTVLSSRQPLLQKRTTRRSQSLSSPQERDVIRRSVLAWQDDQDIRDRTSHSTLLENVSMSWDTADTDTTVDDDLDPVSSADLAEFELTGRPQPQRSNLSDRAHPEFMEVVSVTPGGQGSSAAARVGAGRQEPLMPAKLRPAKEKVNNHSKAEERGDRNSTSTTTSTPRRKLTSPGKPATKGKLSPPGSGNIHGRVSPGVKGSSAGSPRSSGGSSSMDETVVTPLASVTMAPSDDTVTSSSEASAPSTAAAVAPASQQQQQAQQASRSGYEAFTIGPDSSSGISPLVLSPRRTVSAAGSHGDKPAFSYTLESSVHDSQTARDAGIPVIDHGGSGDVSVSADGGETVARRFHHPAAGGGGGGGGGSREGSVGSSRSSGDFSDHESHKIHQDHKARESLKHSPRQGPADDDDLKGHAHHPPGSAHQSPGSAHHSPGSAHHTPGSAPFSHTGPTLPKMGQLITDHLPSTTAHDGGHKKGGTTSFAEIRRMKGLGTVDNSGLVYMQQGQEEDDDGVAPAVTTGNLKSAFLLQKSDGRRGGGQAAKETTWQQSAQRQAASSAAAATASSSQPSNGDRPATSELSQLRLKLEEKRREIERKKQRQEVQQAKMRQRLGKAAFMRVINKKGEGGGDGGEPGGIACGVLRPAWSVRVEEGRWWWWWWGAGRERQAPPQISPHPPTLCCRRGWVRRRPGPDPSPPAPPSLATISPASSNSTSASQSPSTGRLFSRDSDAIHRRWFHGSDPEGDLINRDVTDDAGGIPIDELSSNMMQSCPPFMAAEAFGYAAPRPSSSLGNEARGASPVVKDRGGGGGGHGYDGDVVPAVRERSQTPKGAGRRVSGGSGGGEQEEYDQSLDKLNRNLTELQGEIRRLSLKQQQEGEGEELRSSQQDPRTPPTSQGEHHHTRPQSTTPSSRVSSGQRPARSATPSYHLAPASLIPEPSPPSSTSSAGTPLPTTTSTTTTPAGDVDVLPQEEDTPGFFVSLGDDTPRRSKPRLGRDREGPARKDSGDVSHIEGAEPSPARVPPLHGGGVTAGEGDLGSNHSGSQRSLQSGSDDSSSGVGFVLGQESVDTTRGTEMQKKKERLIQQQQRRKEEQERKRLQKERETQRRQEQKMLKEEEQEKKRAEEKARREAIFQQYLQKKNDQDDSPSPSTNMTSSAVTRRDRSGGSGSGGGQPRPKSMFAKARPAPSEVVEVVDMSASARGLSAHSSQEDVSSHASPTGSNVSCNQLTQNGGQGATTYRRPVSPGPKLFVKPSAKSNRHIIINALSYCCLAGIVNTDMKNKVLEEIAKSAAKHFLILFRDHGCQYRGLYSFDPDTEEAYKIVGIGPRQLSSDMVEHFYKYNSGGKSFTAVTSTKHLSVSIDAVVLQNVYWKTKATAAARR